MDYLAAQLDIADPSCVKNYRVREMTRLEHATQIRDAYGFVEFPSAVEELTRWVDDRAWTTGDGPKALFDGAVVWLREHRVLLPGVSTLTRLVARVRDSALARLWDTLAAPLTAGQAQTLERLLEVPDGARTSELERLPLLGPALGLGHPLSVGGPPGSSTASPTCPCAAARSTSARPGSSPDPSPIRPTSCPTCET